MEDVEKEFSEIAALFGDKSRAVMLWNLLDGRAYTATELAACADISLQSASNHLSKFLKKELVTVAKQGRHRYYKLSGPEIAQVLESMAGLMAIQKGFKKIQRPKLTAFTYARTCYKHLAGEMGVKITNALIEEQMIAVEESAFRVTKKGVQWFQSMEIEVAPLQKLQRSFAHKCLDWSERRYHLAGALGDALLAKMIAKDWFRKQENTRNLVLTALGRAQLEQQLNIKH